MMHNKPDAGSLLYNVYSEADRGIHIDSMFSCVNENKESEDRMAYPACAVITDILELKLRPGPAGLLFLPIFPANEPTEMVGFATTSIHWEEVLDSVVPSYVNGLTCVVSTSTVSKTYEIQNGVPVLIGEGDVHDPQYEGYARSAILNDFMESGADSSAIYTLTVYPTTVMFETFITGSPLLVAVGFFVVIVVCIGVFCIYDYLMRYEALQRREILEMKRRFVRFISHEIRTPLNTVCMGLDLLASELRQQPPPNDEGNTMKAEEMNNQEDLDFWYGITVDVMENANIATSILNDLLHYDKLESGLMKLEGDQVLIWDLMRRTVSQMNIQAVNQKINLDLQLEKPSLPDFFSDIEMGSDNASTTELCVIGEDVRLLQVMRNVISNALKFTSPEGTILVSAEHVVNGLPHAKPVMIEDSNGVPRPACTNPRAGSILIRVKDDGVGMTGDQLKMLFGEGVQFDAGKLQHGGGSGLGLHIARGMVEQHGGSIRAESEGLNKGTTFVIELPLYACPVECSREQDKSCAPTETSSWNFGDVQRPRRILVAEDANSSRKMLIRLLERAGHSCIPATNGREAVTTMKKDGVALTADPKNHIAIDTVLMDFEMPILNGPTATREIREKLGFQGQIIGITGNVMTEDIEHFKESGVDEVFAKPLSMDTLRAYWVQHPDRRQKPLPRSESALSF